MNPAWSSRGLSLIDSYLRNDQFWWEDIREFERPDVVRFTLCALPVPAAKSGLKSMLPAGDVWPKSSSLTFCFFVFFHTSPAGSSFSILPPPRAPQKGIILVKWKSLKNDRNYNVFWGLGGAKGTSFWYFFCLSSKKQCFWNR